MLQYADLMAKLAKICPTGFLAQSALYSSIDTLSKLDAKLVPGRKTTTIAWLAAGLRVVLSWYRNVVVEKRVCKLLTSAQKEENSRCVGQPGGEGHDHCQEGRIGF